MKHGGGHVMVWRYNGVGNCAFIDRTMNAQGYIVDNSLQSAIKLGVSGTLRLSHNNDTKHTATKKNSYSTRYSEFKC